jgi:hypothetical protein
VFDIVFVKGTKTDEGNLKPCYKELCGYSERVIVGVNVSNEERTKTCTETRLWRGRFWLCAVFGERVSDGLQFFVVGWYCLPGKSAGCSFLRSFSNRCGWVNMVDESGKVVWVKEKV